MRVGEGLSGNGEKAIKRNKVNATFEVYMKGVIARL